MIVMYKRSGRNDSDVQEERLGSNGEVFVLQARQDGVAAGVNEGLVGLLHSGSRWVGSRQQEQRSCTAGVGGWVADSKSSARAQRE